MKLPRYITEDRKVYTVLMPITFVIYWIMFQSFHGACIGIVIALAAHHFIKWFGLLGRRQRGMMAELEKGAQVRRRKIGAKIEAMYNGLPPYEAKDLEQSGRLWRAKACGQPKCCFNHIFGDRSSRCTDDAVAETLYEGHPIGMVWCRKHVPPARMNGFTTRELKNCSFVSFEEAN